MERYDLMGTPTASSEEAGVLRIASEVDEKNCGCKDAAITPSNLYNVLNCRKANTAYKGNEIVACPYHTEFLLKCTQAGTTSTGSLDTTSATLGKVYTDGGVKWEVIVLPVELGGTGAITAAKARENLQVNMQTFTALSQLNLDYTATIQQIINAMPVLSKLIFYASPVTTSEQYAPQLELPYSSTVIIEKGQSGALPAKLEAITLRNSNKPQRYVGTYYSYNSIGFTGWYKVACAGDDDFVIERYDDGTNWYKKWASGWLEQGGKLKQATAANITTQITLNKPFATVNYFPMATIIHNGDIGSAVKSAYAYPVSATKMQVTLDPYPSSNSELDYFTWRAEGMGA